MTDQAQIADRATALLGSCDPTRYQEAWKTMSAETRVINKPAARYTDIDLLGVLGTEAAEALIAKITPHLSDIVNRALQTRGLDFAHPETQSALSHLQANGVIAADEYANLIALSTEQVPVYPHLRPGEVRDALLARQVGDI